MLTLTPKAFRAFYKQVISCSGGQPHADLHPDSKIKMICTPSPNVHLILTWNELQILAEILNEADNEIRALELLCLFD